MTMDDGVAKVAAGRVVSVMVIGHMLLAMPDREGSAYGEKAREMFARAAYYLGSEPDHVEVSSTGTVVTTMIVAPPWAQLPPAR